LALPSQVRILPPPSTRSASPGPKFERKLARSGQAIIWIKRRLTIPLGAFDDAGLSVGDAVRVVADGPGRVILERIGPAADTLAAHVQRRLDLTTPSSTDLSRMVSWLYLSAAITIIAGIVFGLTITPIFFALVAVGILDGVIAYLFSSGRLGGSAAMPGQTPAPDDATAVEANPSYNPYARED
jgi:bifunctional DNA-binding transcriptional regulator/antitoxin component of YhaV-PrlF toxin-antitoxin module